MDDTLCHYRRKFSLHKEQYPHVQWPQSKKGFFLDLEPYDDAIESVNKLRASHNVYILTKPSVMNAHSYTEKRLWIESHFGLEFCHNLILCPDKSLLRGDYLIDDFAWPGFQGMQMIFGKPPFETWKDVMKYFATWQVREKNPM